VPETWQLGTWLVTFRSVAIHNPTIPIIDLFAGPGGLGEGFSALRGVDSKFRIGLSIEKDEDAHDTLLLRTFYRQFEHGGAPREYYQYLKGEIDRATLFEAWPGQAAAASAIAWSATLGKIRKETLRTRIVDAIAGASSWVLIGGPPCQAYSLVGRSRTGEDNNDDPRHGLYRHYLRIIAEHQPPVFVMENVRGLLSAKRNGRGIFERMRSDLEHPSRALRLNDGPKYVLHGLDPCTENAFEASGGLVLRSELFGVPQARHRVIIVGVREDIPIRPQKLKHGDMKISVAEVLHGLPALRSRLSSGPDSVERWQDEIRAGESALLANVSDSGVRLRVSEALKTLRTRATSGGAFVPEADTHPKALGDWLSDPALGGACNHQSRGHMQEDLWRYLFAACFAAEKKRSPSIDDFPARLLPAHRNVLVNGKDRPFNDRFRVQLRHAPATTVTAHISKDGHYYIHHDPTQCRAWTVREAARIQTFPDNYFFEGPRTSQFQQVGNAVPPLLARQIAASVHKLLQEWRHGQDQPRTPKLEHEQNTKQGNRAGTSSSPHPATDAYPLPIAAKADGHA
jgi:DNA (cytosine-5)-methyltransferase 1